MKRGTKLVNKSSLKEAEFIKTDGAHTWIKIDGIATPVPNIRFSSLYEVKK